MGCLEGRVALVSGGGRGIGRAIALALAGAGASVAVSSRTRTELDDVVGEIEGTGARGFAVTADMMDRAAIRSMVEAVIERFGRLDVLVNNAGGVIGDIPQLVAYTHDDGLFEDNLFLNLTSAYYATRVALPQMKQQRWGRVIFIGSGYAKNGGGLISYSAAKHGLVGFTRSLAYQVTADGITVNCLCPGWTNTQLVDWDRLAGAYGTTAEIAKAMAEADNVQRRILEPEELGPMAVLLSSDDSRGITGQVISVDGGFKV
ncbi:MAG: meso-butanediol dehydrogenase / (S,S)-butanediol dehydrogenase / diacetyl reductase [Candidatus Binatota bacterium]|nr:meso-butanediol dehydrogenase / (S,S)-butanediol dehydrogenase / diacetyl reductase [Candidatus Binatota bacterium]